MIGWLIALLVWLIVLGVVFWLVTGYLLPLLPEPFRKVGQVITVIIFILILIYLLMGIVPLHAPGPPPLR